MSDTTYSSLQVLQQAIVSCRLCPRLVAWRESVPAKPANKDAPHWRRPVPGFGDPSAHLFITGLAPSAQGGNRTGRIFTGDKSADFLFSVLYKAGFANQPRSVAKDDGLCLKGCYLTACVKCVPPQNKPTHQECVSCSQYWKAELSLLPHVSSILVLGKFAFDAVISYAKEKKAYIGGRPSFSHGAIYKMIGFPTIYASYHPSPQNTNTGRLTEKMLLDILMLT